MNDLYLRLAQSQLGKNLFDALNLPKPPELLREPNAPLGKPTGRVLIAGTKNNVALKQIAKALDLESVKLFTPSTDPKHRNLLGGTGLNHQQNLHTVRVGKDASPRFKSIVFDASGFTNMDDLESLYAFFQPVIRGLKIDGRIVLLAKSPEKNDNPKHAALAASLEGFAKSLAKEIGKKGASCNCIYLEKNAEKHLQSALYYFLSPKSAFVTGQSIVLKTGASMARSIHWDQPLKGKTALVTGAAQGIGEATARVLARDGATVVCLDIPANQKAIDRLAAEINGHALAVDLSQPDAAEQLLEAITSGLGVIDIVVHNAGITRDKTLAKMPHHFWQQVIDINFNKIVEINRVLLEKGAINQRGRLVCISSISGIAGNFGQSNYALSKAGIAGYTRALSKSLPNHITINAIAPGFIETKMTGQIPLMTREMGRRSNTFSQGGLPLDVAETVAFFCHPASQAANGNLLRVCGQSLLGR